MQSGRAPPISELTGPPLASALVPGSLAADRQGLVCEGASGLCPGVCLSGVALLVIEETDFAAISHVDGFVGEDGASAFAACVASVVGPSLRNSPVVGHGGRA